MHFAAPLATQQLNPPPVVNIAAARSDDVPLAAPPPAETLIVGCNTTNVSIRETRGMRRFGENIALNCTVFLVMAYWGHTRENVLSTWLIGAKDVTKRVADLTQGRMGTKGFLHRNQQVVRTTSCRTHCFQKFGNLCLITILFECL